MIRNLFAIVMLAVILVGAASVPVVAEASGIRIDPNGAP